MSMSMSFTCETVNCVFHTLISSETEFLVIGQKQAHNQTLLKGGLSAETLQMPVEAAQSIDLCRHALPSGDQQLSCILGVICSTS